MPKYRIAQHAPNTRVRLWKHHSPFVRPSLSGRGMYAFSSHYDIPLDAGTVRGLRLQSAALSLAFHTSDAVKRIERRLEDCDTSRAGTYT